MLGGTRVSKAHQKIEAYGTVDELNSQLGVLRAFTDIDSELLLEIQHVLFNIGSLLAAERELKMKLPTLDSEDVVGLEHAIDRLNEDLPSLKNFILPGGSKAAGIAHVARTVCRRAERRVVVLEKLDPQIVHYLNRLSDYLFVLSRAILHQEGEKEVNWKK